LTHTTSFGVRFHEVRRRKLDRAIVPVGTKYGEVEVKVGRLAGKVVTRAPEYESCRRVAGIAGVPVKVVYDEAKRVAEETI